MNYIIAFISIPMAALAALYLLIKIIKAVRDRRYGVDILALLAIGATVLAGEYLATIIIIIMLVTGELLERYAGRRAKKELIGLIDHKPQRLYAPDGGELSAKSVRPGTKLLIKTGEMIIIDGVLLSPVATFDTSNITGESLPVTFTKGAQVISGSLNIGPPIEIKTTKRLADSEFSQLKKMVRDIEKTPAPFVRLADRYAIPFTIVSVAIAVMAWVVSGDFRRFAEVLVLASPCPLILAAPVAIISGLSRAFGAGILIKNGTYLEHLSLVKSVAFDKTGTLSTGQIRVSNVQSLSKKYTAKQILKIVASCEIDSPHILAKSIVDYAKSKNLKPAKVQTAEDHLGFGIDAVMGRKTIIIGSLAHLKIHKVATKSQTSTASIYVGIDKTLVGRIDFQDPIRVNALTAIHDLQQQGIKTMAIVTGDDWATARRTADLLGIVNVFAKQLPTDKVATIERLLPKPTLYVGDGLNDAPVLAAADSGMVMGAFGSPLSIDSAGTVVMANNIIKVPEAIRIAKATLKTANRAVLLGVSACIILMLVATTGLIPATIGALLQEAIDVFSISFALAGKKIK